VYKTTASAAQFENCILLQAFSPTQLQLTALRAQAKTLCITYLTNWHNSVIGYGLRTD